MRAASGGHRCFEKMKKFQLLDSLNVAFINILMPMFATCK